MKLGTLAFLLPAITALCFFVSGCREKPAQIVFVVPDGYSGVLKLRSKRPDGLEVYATNQVLTYHFPDTGIIDIQGPLPTLKWHALRAKYRNGTVLPVPFPGSDVPKEAIALRSLGLTSDGLESWDIVGTEAEMAQTYHKKF